MKLFRKSLFKRAEMEIGGERIQVGDYVPVDNLFALAKRTNGLRVQVSGIRQGYIPLPREDIFEIKLHLKNVTAEHYFIGGETVVEEFCTSEATKITSAMTPWGRWKDIRDAVPCSLQIVINQGSKLVFSILGEPKETIAQEQTFPGTQYDVRENLEFYMSQGATWPRVRVRHPTSIHRLLHKGCVQVMGFDAPTAG